MKSHGYHPLRRCNEIREATRSCSHFTRPIRPKKVCPRTAQLHFGGGAVGRFPFCAAGNTNRSSKMTGKTMVVFDFDHTIIEDNSDTWVVEELGLTDLFNQLRRTLPWTSLMDRMMEELHTQGKTIEEIAECLRRVPMNPRIVAAIAKAHALGCDLRIISDANQFFIETILKHYGVFGCFFEIITNPSSVEDEGRLKIKPYHDLPCHGCHLCPPNLCKGLVIEKIQASISEKGKQRMVYLGDGRGDYCPSLKLGEGDHVMPRKDFPLRKMIRNNRMLIKAEVHEWSNGEELERILIQLIDTNSIEATPKLH